jgi:hypothetical protein
MKVEFTESREFPILKRKEEFIPQQQQLQFYQKQKR